MSLESNLNWVKQHIPEKSLKGKRILDVGAMNWDMTLRPFLLEQEPKEIVAIDKIQGPEVSMILDACDIAKHFDHHSFDAVFCLEMLEHVYRWDLVIDGIKNVLKPDAPLFLTTRMQGYARHGFPDDYWRYDKTLFNYVFSDFHIRDLMEDHGNKGIYVHAVKHQAWLERPVLRPDMGLPIT